MLRLIHNQTVAGPILVDDLDDGLPNKMTHRLGSNADPKAYKRDGYANSPKQKCYVPRVKPSDPTVQGYIDLAQTDRVNLSAAKGKIQKLKNAGLLNVVSFVQSDLAAPVVTNAQINTPGAGDVTLTGTGFTSLTPNTSTVLVTGTGGPLTLTQAAILAAGGTISATSIVIPAAIVPGVAAATTFVKVVADDQLSNALALV
jgi:hypothetical protein